MIYEALKQVGLGPWLKLAFHPRAEGLERVPASGAAILASNHLSFADHFLMPVLLSRRVTFLAKAEYFTGRGIKGRATAAFFRGIGQIPIERGNQDAAAAALATGIRVLEGGGLMGIYPEGTRSPDGRLYRGRSGVARLALATGAPVVPVAMLGSFELQPPGRVVPHLGTPVTVRFGEPLSFARYEGMGEDRFVLRAVTDEVMYQIMRLSGQEYVDRYASEVKKEQAAGQAPAVEASGRTSAA